MSVDPQLARRWMRTAGNSRRHTANDESHSNESPKPGIQRLPRPEGKTRDFRVLRPGSKARHGISVPANEVEAMGEGQGVEFVHGSRGELGKPVAPKGFQGRDMRVAARKRV